MNQSWEHDQFSYQVKREMKRKAQMPGANGNSEHFESHHRRGEFMAREALG